ncbi:protein phosphatase CheZ [Thalassobaculum litoreum]|uniref:Chemotaxis protein CheZ n=1 Tax=Thalassobaculum litoreum DSM 18839 TaxID=1123362 RepID=A0A8G2BJK3_9PROT|nr:protein phosphatase CheZ [Thalassobaculum litoreum]SDG07751.1 chemotaxis protein CheZ [Thalassobaculum litoreum DSM 18839]
MMAAKHEKLFSIERRAKKAGAAGVLKSANTDIPPMALADGGVEMILAQIAELRQEVAELRGVKETEIAEDDDMKRDVRVEIAQMVRSIGRAKTQIAAIKNPVMGRDEMEKASLQLEEITKQTEDATNEIMSAADEVEQLLKQIHSHTVEDPDVALLIDHASERLIAIIEACAFQDLTGQRVTQVVKTLRYIESRVLAMIDIWGLEAFKDVDIPDEGTIEGAHDEQDEHELLNGPALGGQGLSQADIDALFD